MENNAAEAAVDDHGEHAGGAIHGVQHGNGALGCLQTQFGRVYRVKQLITTTTTGRTSAGLGLGAIGSHGLHRNTGAGATVIGKHTLGVADQHPLIHIGQSGDGLGDLGRMVLCGLGCLTEPVDPLSVVHVGSGDDGSLTAVVDGKGFGGVPLITGNSGSSGTGGGQQGGLRGIGRIGIGITGSLQNADACAVATGISGVFHRSAHHGKVIALGVLQIQFGEIAAGFQRGSQDSLSKGLCNHRHLL